MSVCREGRKLGLLILCLAVVVPGCASGRNANRGSVLGTVVGSALGGVIGHQSGNTADGVILGALAGGMTGNVLGDIKDEQESLEARQASYEYAAQQAVTNSELVMMVQNGISDEVIIGTVKSRGARVDLSPAAIIEMKNNGVSDRVILGIQDAARSSPPSTTVVTPASTRVESSIVVVRPAPVIGIGFSRGHHHHCPPPRRHVHYHFD